MDTITTRKLYLLFVFATQSPTSIPMWTARYKGVSHTKNRFSSGRTTKVPSPLSHLVTYSLREAAKKSSSLWPGGFPHLLIYSLTDLLSYWLIDLLTYWLTDLLTYWLTDLLTYWLTDLLTYWLIDLLTYWLTELQTYWLTDLLTYWLTDLLI